MENNFIQMAASARHAIAYMIGPIFKHIIDCVKLYFTNGEIASSVSRWQAHFPALFKSIHNHIRSARG